jgi:serine/threonine-protein kinase RsbW
MTVHPPKIFELTISSTLEQLNEVRNLVGHVVQECCLGEDLAYWMELTVTESMINAIRHGNQLDPSKKASLTISSDGASIEIIVEDQGEGFSLEDLADPTVAENLLKPTGRGILIIRSFMDEVGLSLREGGGSRLRMVKKLEAIRS